MPDDRPSGAAQPQGRRARSAGELDAMAAAGSLVASALLAVRQAAAPGIVDAGARRDRESVIRDGGGSRPFSGITASRQHLRIGE
jgi:Xaa-Pro aminopeptidase